MKKLLFSLIIFSISSPISAQVLWSDDFSNATNWTIAVDGANPAGWEFSNDPSVLPINGPMNSATSSNGFLFVSSDANNTSDNDGTPISTTATNVTPINLSGFNEVLLRFEHQYRWWQDTRGVRVSGDNGASWTEYLLTTSGFDPGNCIGCGPGQNYPNNQTSENPVNESIDISDVAGGQTQVLIQFYYNDNDYWSWYWAVDDVNISVIPQYDAQLDDVIFGSTGAWGEPLAYYQVPITQVAPISFAGVVSNQGVADINATFSAICPGVYEGVSDPTLLTPGTQDTLYGMFTNPMGIIDTALFYPPGPAIHTIEFSVATAASEVEEDIDNNVFPSYTVDVNEYIYARDLGTATGAITYNSGYEYEVGNIFDIYADQVLYGIDVVAATSSAIGAEVRAKLYSYDSSSGEPFIFMAESDILAIDAGDLGNVKSYVLQSPIMLTAGQSYLVVAATYGDGGASNDLTVATSGGSAPYTSHYYDGSDATWYYTLNTPMVRMNFESPCISFDTSYVTDNHVVCNSFTWIDGNTYTSNNNTATYTEVLPTNCEATIYTLNLTVDCPVCAPDLSFADSTYGIWPDTVTNLPSAEVGVPYSTVLNFKIPDEVTEDVTGGDPNAAAFIGSEIQSYTVTSVDGLPPGYEFNCNTEGCAYLGGEIGCGTIFGTTFNAGVYPLTIAVEAVIIVVLFPGLPPTPVTQVLTFSGYQIVVNESNAVIENINPVVCGSFTSPAGNIYLESGAYVDTIFQANTIDSIYNIDLTILPTYETTISDSFCGSYTLNGQTYTSAGVYTQSYTTSLGCDSTVILNLTEDTFYSTLTETACGSYSLNGEAYNSSGTYTQTVMTAEGCDSIITLELTISSDDFDISFTSNEQLFTSPPFAVAFSNTSDDLANYTYTWYWGDGSSTTSNNGTVFHEYLNNGLYTVTLEATNNATGCTDEITYTDYIYTTGGVSCSHIASILESGPIDACQGQTIILTCNSDANYSYQWSRNGVYISGNNNDSLAVTTSGAYAVIITENNCPVSSQEILVTFTQSIPTPVITASGSITSCAGGSVILDAGSGYDNYLWSSGGASQTETVTSSGDYTVTVSDVSGCTLTSSPYTVNASFMDPQQVCIVGMDSLSNYNRVVWEKPISDGIDYFNVYKEGNAADVYDLIGSVPYEDTAIFVDENSNTAVQAYRYKVSIVDSCGTESALGTFHKTIHLTINQGVGQTWNLIWNHYEGFGFPSYNIYRGSDANNMTLLATIASNLNSYTDLNPPGGVGIYYQVEVVNTDGCDPLKSTDYGVSRSNIATVEVVNQIELGKETLSIYPNPTRGNVTISASSALTNGYVMYDQQGRVVLTGALKGKHTSISLEQLSRGSYTIKVEGNYKPLVIINQ